MQSILRRKFFILLVPFVLAFTLLTVIAAGQETFSAISGSILINIKYYGYKYIEFKLQDGKINKIAEGNVIYFKENGKYTGKSINSSDNFKNIYDSERRYHYQQEEKLSTILSQYNLEELERLRLQFRRNKGNLEQTKHFLTGPGKKFSHFDSYAYSFLPNKQFSYAIYYWDRYHIISPLVNLQTKEISFPFGLDELEHIVWNNNGQSVAYSTPRDQGVSLVIHDISQDKTLLRKGMEKYISDITWSPDSSAVALLTYTERTSTSPGDILAGCVGHPYPIRTFYLEIYDLSGNLITNEKINGELKSSEGRLVWTP
jgi:hypothetical protein